MVDWISAKATVSTTSTAVPMTAMIIIRIIAKLHDDYIMTYHFDHKYKTGFPRSNVIVIDKVMKQ